MTTRELIEELSQLLQVADANLQGKPVLLTLFAAGERTCERLRARSILTRNKRHEYSMSPLGKAILASIANHYKTLRDNSVTGNYLVEVTTPRQSGWLRHIPQYQGWFIATDKTKAEQFPSIAAATSALSAYIAEHLNIWDEPVTLNIRETPLPIMLPPPLPPPRPISE